MYVSCMKNDACLKWRRPGAKGCPGGIPKSVIEKLATELVFRRGPVLKGPVKDPNNSCNSYFENTNHKALGGERVNPLFTTAAFVSDWKPPNPLKLSGYRKWTPLLTTVGKSSFGMVLTVRGVMSRKKIAELIASGRVHSVGQISRETGLSVSSVVRHMKELVDEYRESWKDDFEMAIMKESLKIDKVESELMKRMGLQDGREVNDDDFMRAALVWMRLQERRSRMLGLEHRDTTSADIAESFRSLVAKAHESLPPDGAARLEAVANTVQAKIAENEAERDRTEREGDDVARVVAGVPREREAEEALVTVEAEVVEV